MVELDFTDLAPDTAPDQDEVKRAIADADRVSVAGPVSALSAVLAALRRRDLLDIGVSWTPSGDPLASGLSRAWGMDAGGRLSGGSPRTLGLVLDDRGGVLLARGRITAAVPSSDRPSGGLSDPSSSGSSGGSSSRTLHHPSSRSPLALGRGRTGSRFGAQIYHDEKRVADGDIVRVDVRPDWTAEDVLKVSVHQQLWRRGELSRGRAIQIACDEARIEIDGVPFPRPMTKWTWYADPRLRWNLISV